MAKQNDSGLINCGRHGKRLGFIVCVHVMKHGANVAAASPATVQQTGDALCQECAGKATNNTLSVDSLLLVCIKCLREVAGDRWPKDVPFNE